MVMEEEPCLFHVRSEGQIIYIETEINLQALSKKLFFLSASKARPRPTAGAYRFRSRTSSLVPMSLLRRRNEMNLTCGDRENMPAVEERQNLGYHPIDWAVDTARVVSRGISGNTITSGPGDLPLIFLPVFELQSNPILKCFVSTEMFGSSTAR
jgi:hypothetical protein